MIFVCVKAGTKYNAEYVNRLYRSVQRNLSVPIPFVCLTENTRGVDSKIKCLPLENNLEGWWNKLLLFKPLKGLDENRLIFLDLDTVIVDNIDFLTQYNGPFCILQDFYNFNGYGSAVMSIAPEFGRDIWTKFKDAGFMCDFPGGDQNWIQHCVPKADLWQRLYPDKIVSFKAHNCARQIPKAAAIVCYHGLPKPEHTTELPWVREMWC